MLTALTRGVSLSNKRRGSASIIAHDYRIFAHHVLVGTGDLQVVDFAVVVFIRDSHGFLLS